MSFDPSYFDVLADIEDRHFWFRHRNRLIVGLLQQITADWPAGRRLVEVGCGNGNVLRTLPAAVGQQRVFGMDLFRDGLLHARKRTPCDLVQADVHSPPFRKRFHLVGLFDVLEHLQDDRGILRDIHQMLVERGILILTVPAHMSLWSYFDEASHHCRRYSRRELNEKLTESGFSIDFMTEIMLPLFPLVWLGRRMSPLIYSYRRRPSDVHALAKQELTVIPIVNQLLAGVLYLEACVTLRRLRLPAGTSVLAIARKR